MKKICFLVLSLTLLVTQVAWASYYRVDIDGLTDIHGLGVDVVTTHDAPAYTDFTVETALVGWMAWAVTSPSLGAQAANLTGSAIDASAAPVTAFTIGADYDFTLDNFLLADGAGEPIGTPYVVSFNGTDTYTCAPVPIPGALWLLGSGLFGLLAIRRRRGDGM